jgi:hypothetical protein
MKKLVFSLFAAGTLLFPALALPALVSAQTLPFGGLVVNTTVCTCPATAGNLLITFAPFWFGASDVPSGGSLVYIPWLSKLYAWFEIGVPGTYHLGSYVPGIQACWMYSGNSCFPLPSMGVIYQVGTSKSF